MAKRYRMLAKTITTRTAKAEDAARHQGYAQYPPANVIRNGQRIPAAAKSQRRSIHRQDIQEKMTSRTAMVNHATP